MSDHTAEPASVAQAREQVARSRARMSETIDAIEDRLLEKKSALREKLDVKKRITEQVDRSPVATIAAAAGIGFLLGLVGRRRRAESVLDDADRDELLALLQEARSDDEDAPERTRSRPRPHPSFWQETRAQLVGALTAALVAMITERVRPHGPRRDDVERDTDDEPRPPHRRRRRRDD